MCPRAVDIDIATVQLISFIDTSSGVDTAAGPNRNIYYLNTFSAAVRSSTSVFLSNAERQVSRLVEQFFVYRGGSIDLAVAIDDLTAQISSLTVSTPALALVVAAGSSSRPAAVAAADRLRSSYGGGVSLGCVPLGSVSSENVATLAAIASTGLVRSSLSLRAPSLLSIAAQCTSVLRSLGAYLHQRSSYDAYTSASAPTWILSCGHRWFPSNSSGTGITDDPWSPRPVPPLPSAMESGVHMGQGNA